MFEFLRDRGSGDACACRPRQDRDVLRIDARDCPHGGDLESSAACRSTAVDTLTQPGVSRIDVVDRGVRRTYREQGFELLEAAAAFSRRIQTRDARLADLARRDPLQAAREASGRAGLVGEVAESTGITTFVSGTPSDSNGSLPDTTELFRPFDTPRIAAATVDWRPPPGGTLRSRRVTDTGATVRVYDADGDLPRFHIEPIEYTLDGRAFETLESAKRALIDGNGLDADRPSPHEAVASVAGPDQPVDILARVLGKHTSGYGILDDVFSDDSVSDVFLNAPADRTGLHVRSGGTTMRTNVTIGPRGRAQLASRVRTESGRAFSRASPTIDALLTGVSGTDAVRVAGIRPPASDGIGFALRAEAADEWRLSRLVRLKTLSPEAAGLLSVAMKRGAAILVAGPRGAGKTTMTSALLWELDAGTRVLTIEDTPELPVRALQSAGRDAQRLRASTGSETELTPKDALHTALRLGDGALVVGEVRGEEAAVLYEAMRVGAAADTVLGTIHGEGYEGVRERVVSDLGVPATSFATTDLLITLAPVDGTRRVVSIEEVTSSGAAPLFTATESGLGQEPRMDRGNSAVVEALSAPQESYAGTIEAIESRATEISPWIGAESTVGPSRDPSAVPEGVHR
ncbi:MAG: ATPase, T2SS/T4P/T4SS family [Halodesulfurarchaeum sp.]